MFCSKCGREVVDDTRFCPHCGNELKQPPDKQASPAHDHSVSVAAAVAKTSAALGSLKPLRQFAPRGAIYLALAFGVPLALLAIAAAILNGLVAGAASSPAQALLSSFNIFDPRILLALVSLGFGGSLVFGANADLSSFAPSGSSDPATALLSGAAQAASKPAGSGEVLLPLLLLGCLATIAMLVYALKFDKNPSVHGRSATIKSAVATGLAAAGVYALVEFLFPFSLSVAGLASLSVSGLSLRTFVAMGAWVGLSVLAAEGLRQGKTQCGSVAAYLREALASHKMALVAWQACSTFLVLAVVAGALLLVVGFATDILAPTAIFVLLTPLSFMAAAFLVGAPLTASVGTSGNATAQLLSSAMNGPGTDTSTLFDVSVFSLASSVGALVLAAVVLYAAFVLLVALARHRAFGYATLQGKETALFVAMTAVLWAVVCVVAVASANGEGAVSEIGINGSASLSISWLAMLAGAAYAFLADVVAAYAVPRLAFLRAIEDTAFVAVLAGVFCRDAVVAPASAVSSESAKSVEPACDEHAFPAQPTGSGESSTPTGSSEYGATRPVQKQSAKKQLSEKQRRRMRAAGGAAAALVAAALAVQVLGATVFSPQRLVEDYYRAIADGDFAAAAALCDPNLDTASRSLLVEGVLADPEKRIKNVSVSDSRQDAVAVTYQLDGVEHREEVFVQEDGTELLFFKKYRIAVPAVRTVTLRADAGSDVLLVNGVEVPLEEQDADGQGAVALPVYPGVYTVSKPQSAFVTCDELHFVVAEGLETSASPVNGMYGFSVGFTQQLNDQVKSLVAQHLEACMATGEAEPQGAPFGYATGLYSSSFKGWTRIESAPTTNPVTGSERVASGKKLVLDDGAVYYCTTGMGSIRGNSGIADARENIRETIEPFDVYVKVVGESVTLEDAEGNVLFGLAEVSEDGQGAASAAASAEAVQQKEALADYTWGEIIAIADEIGGCSNAAAAKQAAQKYHLVDDRGACTDSVKSVSMSDGTTIDVQLIGVFQDDKADATGKAALSFLVKESFARRCMNEADTNAGGWRDCTLRAWLNSDVHGALPEELRGRIVAVKKLTNNEGPAKSANSVSETSDKLWLPSWTELFGTITWNAKTDQSYIDSVLNAEGEQYAYFAEHGLADAQDSDAEGVLVKHAADGSVDSWWVRSPAPNRDNGFGDVNNGGLDNGGIASAAQGVVFGFCL